MVLLDCFCKLIIMALLSLTEKPEKLGGRSIPRPSQVS